MNNEEVKTRRGMAVYKKNPFVGAGMVKSKTRRLTNQKGDMMVVGETGEIIAPAAGFWQAQEVDAAKFVKLYVNGVRAFTELTNAGTKVLSCFILKYRRILAKTAFI